jgi:hypothetical protein
LTGKLKEAIAARPPLSCADLPTCPNPRDRRCNRRFLDIFASPQDAVDAYEADRYFLGNCFAGLASAVEFKDLICLCPKRSGTRSRIAWGWSLVF